MNYQYTAVQPTDAGLRLELREPMGKDTLMEDLAQYGLASVVTVAGLTSEVAELEIPAAYRQEAASRLSLLAFSSPDTLRQMPEVQEISSLP